MTFLAPYWLFAASAILLPIALHLWNKRPGKTVKVGSLRWLEASASKRWSSIRLHDVGLLLLRCAILVLLAVALAQPVWVRPARKSAGKKAVLVAPELLYTAARQALQPSIDALLQRGYTLHEYSTGFRQLTAEQWQKIRRTTTDTTLTNTTSYWRLLPALAQKYNQPQDSVWLFTSDQRRYFTGTRPDALPENIHWLPVAIEIAATWLQAAVQPIPDSLLLLIGHSTRESISYSQYRTATNTPQLVLKDGRQLHLQLVQDSLRAIIGHDTSFVQLQQKPLQVAILTNSAQKNEKRYLQAALEAISSYTGFPIRITADTTGANWVFWLGNEPLPQALKQRVPKGAQVWVQPGTKPQAVTTTLPGAAGTAIKVYQLSRPAQTLAAAATAVWTAADATPLLTVQPQGQGNLYTFRTGFDPSWSELGRSGQVPERLLPLLFPSQQGPTYDARALDEAQLIPLKRVAVTPAAVPAPRSQPLLRWVVLAAFLLFIAERFIAGRRARDTYGS
ncbi:BatA domain-containing protein [Pontibacter liquoris]|uniref:BatA domain-containing protein n=1 Tax=Pontibacter liquoris TaxID=2905677 RepID=UPI001FA72891|nr:BatA domain-containing protein [Pontibacter liquoris]